MNGSSCFDHRGPHAASGAPPRSRSPKGRKVVVAGRRDEAGKALVRRAALSRCGGRVHQGRRPQGRRCPRSGRQDRRALWPSRCRGEQCRHRRQARPDHGPDRGKLCRDVRHQCSRRAPEHEARSARHAGTGQRQHHQHLLDLWARGRGGGLRSMSAASTPSKASPSRWRSSSPSRGSA